MRPDFDSILDAVDAGNSLLFVGLLENILIALVTDGPDGASEAGFLGQTALPTVHLGKITRSIKILGFFVKLGLW